jgi:ornithine cyclodeaminase/alanine dehydrogenase-like protein (mu-crystallin family)
MTDSNPHARTLVICGADVRRLFPMSDCIELMRATMRAVSRGDATLPLRIGAAAPDGALAVATMPGWLGEPQSLGAKVISVALRHGESPTRSHQGVVVLFDPDTGTPSAIVDASAVTELRTAAASAVATDALARTESAVLAILGAGAQARAHVDALARIRRFREIRIWGRNADRAEAFARDLVGLHGIAVSNSSTARDAVAHADVVVTATAAREPILCGEWLAPGTHVNLVGASSRAAREADDVVVTRSRFFVDYRGSALAQAGELLHACADVASTAEATIAGEIGEVLSGTVPGRRDDREITVYKSLGIAAQDLALAHEVLARARAAGVGTPVGL